MTDREAIEALTDKTVVNPYLTLEALEIAIDALRERAERKTGKWVFVHQLQEYDDGVYVCSCCETGSRDVNPRTWKSCPWCTALMEVE